MPYELLYSRCPQTAEEETRVIILAPENEFGLPPGDYGFMESFCNEDGCDCSRVFFNVVRNSQPLAVIFWGWESKAFYQKWWGSSTGINIQEELMGPGLDLLNRQSDLAPAILKMFIEILMKDNLYLERVKKHYELFRKMIIENQ